MRPITEIIIHCSATRPDWMQGRSTASKVAEIKRWHTTPPRSWSDIGYHYLIDRDGSLVSGRPVSRVGAHVRGKNRGTIGVALIGGHGGAETDTFREHFTADQEATLREFLDDMAAAYPTINKITGHNQYAAKACPCFSVPDWLKAGRPAPPTQRPQPPAAPAPRQNPIMALLRAFLERIGVRT